MDYEFNNGTLTVPVVENAAPVPLEAHEVRFTVNGNSGPQSKVVRKPYSEHDNVTDGSGLRRYLFKLTLDDNRALGLSRRVGVEVRAIAADGGEGDWFEAPDAVNPAPVLSVAPTVVAGFDAATITITAPSASDIAGYRVHRGATTGFAVSGTKPGEGTCVANGPDTVVTIPLTDDSLVFFKVGAIDSFGDDTVSYLEIGPVSRTSLGPTVEEILDNSATVEALQAATQSLDSRIEDANDLIDANRSAAEAALATAKTDLEAADEGLASRTASLETATTDLAANKADASRVTALEATVNTAGTGLKARTIALETATSSLATGKADASRVTVVEAQAAALNARTGNGNFDGNLDGWAYNYSGNPTQTGMNVVWASSLGGRTGVAKWAANPTETLGRLFSVRKFPVDPARKYRIRVSTYVGAGTGVVKFYAGFRALGPDGAPTHTGNQYAALAGSTRAAGTGWVDTISPIITGTGTSATAFPAGTTTISLLGYLNYDNNTGVTDVAMGDLYLEDVTDAEAAASVAARATTLETATANLQTGKADASRVTALEATTKVGRNLLLNPAPVRGMASWTAASGSWTTYQPAGAAGHFYSNTNTPHRYIYSDNMPVSAGATYTVQYERYATGFTGGTMLGGVRWLDASGNFMMTTGNGNIDVVAHGQGGWVYGASVHTAPAGAAFARVVVGIYDSTNSGGYTEVGARRLKFEFGSSPTLWTDDAETVQLGARLTTAETATTSLATSKADASRVTALEATVNTAGTGLTARTGALESATADLQTGKADAARVTSLEAKTSAAVGATGRWDMADGLASVVSSNTQYLSYAATHQGRSHVILAAAGTSPEVFGKDKWPIDPSRKWRVRGSVWVGPGSGSAAFYMGLRCYDAAGNILYSDPGTYLYSAAVGAGIPANSGWVELDSQVNVGHITGEGTGSWAIFPVGTRYAVPLVLMNYGGNFSGVTAVDGIYLEEITDSVAITGLTARTTSLETATVNLAAAKADASRVTALEVSAKSKPNLIRNPSGAQGLRYWQVSNGAWSYNDDLNWGDWIWHRFDNTAEHNFTIYSEPFAAGYGATWTFSFDAFLYGLTTGAVDVRVYGYTNSAATTGETTMGVSGINLVAAYGGSPGIIPRQSFTFTAPSNIVTFRVWVQGHGVGASYAHFGFWKMKLEQGSQQTAFTDNATDRATFARVTTTESAVVDLNGKTQARWALGASVDGADAFIEARAEVTPGSAPTSSVAIGAKSVSIYSASSGQWKKALDVTGDKAVFSGDLQAGAVIRQGNRQGWPVALKAVDFKAKDGDVINYGTTFDLLPSISFSYDNCSAPASGESYNFRAENPTGSGFTFRAKINVPGTPAAQSKPQTTTVQATGPRFQIERSTSPESADGSYSIRVAGSSTFRVYTETEDEEFSGSGNVAIWARKGGTWYQLGTVPYSWSTTASNPSTTSNITLSAGWSNTAVVQLGAGVDAWGASLSNGSTLNSLGPIEWTATGTASGERSATPQGQLTTITIRPQ